MAFFRNQQMFIAMEQQQAQAIAIATLITAVNGTYNGLDPQIKYNPQKITRALKRGTLTPAQDLNGRITGEMKFGLEVCGWATSGAALPSGVPSGTFSQIDLPLQACGFRREKLQKFTIGAITGASRFIHGETVTETTSLATGTVVMDTYDGNTTLWLAAANGLGNGTAFTGSLALTGTTSGAVATSTGAPTNIAGGGGGIGYWPSTTAIYQINIAAASANAVAAGVVVIGGTSGATGVVATAVTTSDTNIKIFPIAGTFVVSETIKTIGAVSLGTTPAANPLPCIPFIGPTLSMGMTLDGVWQMMYGSRGTPVMHFPVGQLPFIDYTFSGVVDPTTDTDVTDGLNIAGIALPQFIPPVFQQANFKIGASGGAAATLVSPCGALIEFSMNNQISPRECWNALGGGVLNYEITARTPSGTIDPELQPEAFFNVVGKSLNNQNVVLQWQVKPTSAPDGNTFYFQVPCAGIKDITNGERNLRAIRKITYTPNNGASGVVTTAQDNDIVIVHDFAAV